MLPLVVSHPLKTELLNKAKTLAQQWGFHLSKEVPAATPFYLLLDTEKLQLFSSDKHCSRIFVDFTSGAIEHRRKFGGGKGQTIAKAIGFNKISCPVILDATAGMGKDAFVFASLGAQVILMERSPVAAALLTDALLRAQAHPEVQTIVQRMQFRFGDARELSRERIQSWDKAPDVVYLDPMFPHRKKSALVKKEMLAFQTIIGDDADSGQLLETGLNIAQKRVVVKRPIKAPCLNNQKPTYCMKMKKHRFDIYII